MYSTLLFLKNIKSVVPPPISIIKTPSFFSFSFITEWELAKGSRIRPSDSISASFADCINFVTAEGEADIK